MLIREFKKNYITFNRSQNNIQEKLTKDKENYERNDDRNHEYNQYYDPQNRSFIFGRRSGISCSWSWKRTTAFKRRIAETVEQLFDVQLSKSTKKTIQTQELMGKTDFFCLNDFVFIVSNQIIDII